MSWRNFRRNEYSELVQDDERNNIPLQSDSNRQHKIRQEQTLEAEVLPGDTINSISIRFNCTIQDIKRLNKIDKDNEIYAFRVVKVPLTAQNLLLDTLPKVHKSGQSSPNNNKLKTSSSTQKEKDSNLQEKLLVASVISAVITQPEDAADRSAGDIEPTSEEPLVDRTQFRGYPRQIAARNDYLSFNGSDCELNWIVLLFCILAVCVIVPLVIFYLVFEHPEKFAHEHIKYDDPDIGVRQLHHLNDKHFSSTSNS
jgi:LysM domain